MKSKTSAVRWPQPCRWIAILSLLLCIIFLYALPLAAQKCSELNTYIQKAYQRMGGIYYAYPVPPADCFALRRRAIAWSVSAIMGAMAHAG